MGEDECLQHVLHSPSKGKGQELFMLTFWMNFDHRNSFILFIVQVRSDKSTPGRVFSRPL